MPLQTKLKTSFWEQRQKRKRAGRGPRALPPLPMFSATAASNFNTFRPFLRRRQRKMCPRTKKWRRTLSDEAEGGKGERVLHFAVRRRSHRLASVLDRPRRRERSVAHEKPVAVSRRCKWAQDGSLDNRKSETDAHPLGPFVNSHLARREDVPSFPPKWRIFQFAFAPIPHSTVLS